jgi:hypothetical protein
MARINLTPNPTFKAKVEICRAGLDPEKVEFTFRHRTRDAMDEFVKQLADLSIEEQVMAVACGWELEDPFDIDHVKLLAQNYITAPAAIRDKYIAELIKAREKN